jgi:nickel-type superoxide dismutase maturation protease
VEWNSLIDDHLIHGRAMTNRPLPSSRPSRVLRAAVVVAVVVAWALRLAGVRRVVVEGTSMLPTLAPGDRLLIRRVARPAPGDLVALADPRLPARLLVKRVAVVDGDRVALRGDNPARSTDSRVFGTVPMTSLRGRVVRRYAPAGRRGRVD